MKRHITTIVAIVGILCIVAGVAIVRAAQNPAVNLQGPTVYGGLKVYGSITQSAIGTPSAPTATHPDGGGATTRTYYCVATDVNGKDSIPSSALSDTTGPTSLSSTSRVIVQCANKVGAIAFKVLKTNTSTLLGTCASPSGGGCEVTDYGQSTSGYTAQSSDLTGPLGNTGNGPGAANQHYLVRQTSGLCSTSAASNAVCGEPTITGLPFADVNYSVACSCVGTPAATGAGMGPVVQYVVKAAATGGVASNAQVFIGGTAAGTVSCAEVDCNFWHD